MSSSSQRDVHAGSGNSCQPTAGATSAESLGMVLPSQNQMETMTQLIRSMHMKSVVQKMQSRVCSQDEIFSMKPNYALMLTKKFSSFLPEEADLEDDDEQSAPDDESLSEKSLIVSKKGRGRQN